MVVTVLPVPRITENSATHREPLACRHYGIDAIAALDEDFRNLRMPSTLRITESYRVIVSQVPCSSQPLTLVRIVREE